MTTKHFYGKHEHSTTYAAASFLMPGAAARVEAIRAKKRKLKHASSPPPSAPEAPPAVKPITVPSGTPAPEPAAHTEQQAETPVEVFIPTNREEAHNSRVVAETDATSKSPVMKEVPDLAEQHEAGTIVTHVNLAPEHPDEPAESPEYVNGTIESAIPSASEIPQTEQPKQAESDPLQNSEQSEHHEETSHEAVETVDSSSENTNSNPTQDDEVPEVDHPIDDEENSDPNSNSPEPSRPTEEPSSATEVVHTKDENQTPPPVADLQSENVSPTAPRVAAIDTTTDNKSVTEQPTSTDKAAHDQNATQEPSPSENPTPENVTPTELSVENNVTVPVNESVIGELARIEEVVHNDQNEQQTPSPVEDIPAKSATSTEPPVEETPTVTGNDPVPSLPSSTAEDKTGPQDPSTSTPALIKDTKQRDQVSTTTSSASSPSPSQSPSSSPSKHAPIKSGEVDWVKRPEFD